MLQEREITRVGSRKAIKVNVRVIAATHVDWPGDPRAPLSRGSLLSTEYRGGAAAAAAPASAGYPLLAHHFLSLYARRLGRPTLRLAPESLARLMDYSWPGNIRELENTLHNAVLLSKEEEISPAQLRWRRSTTPRGRRAIMNWTTLFATSWRFPASRCGSE